MKKKVFTGIAVCALSAACAFGATACNKKGEGSGVPDVGPSVQVTEEQWNAALDKTATATNYTVSAFSNSTETVDGKKIWIHQRKTMYVVGEELYDIFKTFYGKATSRDETYIKKEETVAYVAYWDGSPNGWIAYIDANVDAYSNNINFTKYNYSEFNYEDEKYTGNITESIYGEEMTVAVTIKFSSDGYVSYFSQRIEDEDKSGFMEIAIYDYGTTTCTFPAEAKKAIEDYKAANN